MSKVEPPEGLRTLSDPEPDAVRLVLVRHGQGEVNVSGVIGGTTGCTGLTDVGRAQVGALAARLAATGELAEADALVSSVLPRAIETAEIIAPAIGIDPARLEQDCELCELHPGEADGLVWERYVERYEVPDWDRDPFPPIAPGGEGWASFVDRVRAGLEALADRSKGQLVVVATHAGVIEAAMISFLVGEAPGSAHRRLRLRTKHASMTEWERSSNGWKLLRYNDVAAPLNP